MSHGGALSGRVPTGLSQLLCSCCSCAGSCTPQSKEAANFCVLQHLCCTAVQCYARWHVVCAPAIALCALVVQGPVGRLRPSFAKAAVCLARRNACRCGWWSHVPTLLESFSAAFAGVFCMLCSSGAASRRAAPPRLAVSHPYAARLEGHVCCHCHSVCCVAVVRRCTPRVWCCVGMGLV